MKSSLHVQVVLALPSHTVKAVLAQDLADRLKVGVADVDGSLLTLRRAYLATKQSDKWNLTVRGVFFRHSLQDLKLV